MVRCGAVRACVRVIDMATPCTSSASKWQTDWSKCCLCQQDMKEELKSPPNSYQPEQDGYTNIATNVPLFKAMKALPIMLDPARLNEGEGIEQTLRKNNAKYHRSCRLMFNNSKLKRAQKRASSATEETRDAQEKSQGEVLLHLNVSCVRKQDKHLSFDMP